MTTWSIMCHGGPRDGERVAFARDGQTRHHPPLHYLVRTRCGPIYEYELVETRAEGPDFDITRWEYR